MGSSDCGTDVKEPVASTAESKIGIDGTWEARNGRQVPIVAVEEGVWVSRFILYCSYQDNFIKKAK